MSEFILVLHDVVENHIGTCTFTSVKPAGTFCQCRGFDLKTFYCKLLMHDHYANIFSTSGQVGLGLHLKLM